MDLDEKKVRSKYGELLFSRFMNYLTQNTDVWKHNAVCVNHGQDRHPSSKPLLLKQKDSKTYFGMFLAQCRLPWFISDPFISGDQYMPYAIRMPSVFER